MMNRQNFKPGDRVVFRKPKRSTCPGPRATNVSPSRHGEDYTYFVEKYWIVVASADGKVIVRTRSGKQHVLDSSNGFVRHARLWDILIHRHRFPSKTDVGTVN